MAGDSGCQIRTPILGMLMLGELNNEDISTMTMKRVVTERTGAKVDSARGGINDTLKIENSYESIWDAIESNAGEAAIMRVRSVLLMTLVIHVRNWNVTPAQAAKRLNITTALIKEILQGNINVFTIESLVELCDTVGFVVNVDVSIKSTSPT